MITKTYDLQECPDGRAFIVRSGVGVFLIDRKEGSQFAWGEAYTCDWFEKSAARQFDGMNKDRPLDFDHIVRSPL